MVTLMSESSLYALSSNYVPESRVTHVICHHSLGQGLQAVGLALVGPYLPPDARLDTPNASAHLFQRHRSGCQGALAAAPAWASSVHPGGFIRMTLPFLVAPSWGLALLNKLGETFHR
jgi:hypothetical protein